MKFILGIILFWIMIIGIKKFIEKKTKIDNIFTLPLTFSLIGIIMFISGILNIMMLTSLMLIIFGCSNFVISFSKEKKELLNIIKNYKTIIIILIFIYITLVGLNMHLTHYDNFSHWGLIIKNMFMDNALPNFDNTTILFKGYQPGSACFIYLFGLICGKTEVSMIIAQNYLIFSFLIPLFGFINKDNKYIKSIMIIIFYLFITVILIKFNDLLVDSLIATMTITSLSIIYNYKKDLKKAFYYSLPVSIFLFLVKNTGLVFAGFNCLYLLYLSYKNKKIKEGIKYVIVTGIILLFFLIIWQSHVKLVYGDLATQSKHSLTFSNIFRQLWYKGFDNIFIFIKNYILNFFKLNISNIYIIIINIIMFLIFIFEKEKKKVLNLMAVVNLIYLIYFIILGLMYILSMPWEEAIRFASYDRYMNTVIVIIVGILFMYIFQKNKNKFVQMLVTSLMLCTIFINKSLSLPLIGIDGYRDSLVEQYDKLISNTSLEENNEYYIYSPSSANDDGYLIHLSMYKLNTNKINIITRIEQLEENLDGYLIVFEEDEEIKKYIKKEKCIKLQKQVYEIKLV